MTCRIDYAHGIYYDHSKTQSLIVYSQKRSKMADTCFLCVEFQQSVVWADIQASIPENSELSSVACLTV